MSYQRKLEKKPATSQPVSDFTGIENLATWLAAQANTQQMNAPCYLLAHATDGVIWGRLDENGRLFTSHDALHNARANEKWDGPRLKNAKGSLPRLQVETVQQLRLFNEQAELYVWCDGDGGWNGRWLLNVAGSGSWSESFDEPQLLWGTHGTQLADDFTLLEDGAQGLYHAAPIPLELDADPKKFGETHPPRLLVRHYLDYDEQGQAYVALSRLVALKKGGT